MKKLKHLLQVILVSMMLLAPIPAKADLFGGDIVVLTKILFQTIQQLEISLY